MAKASKSVKTPASNGAAAVQGATSADLARERGERSSAVTVAASAKMDRSATPSSAPEIVPARHQQGNGGPSSEGALASGQAPSPEQIARRAYQMYLDRGGSPGRDQDDWYAAERELRAGARH